MMNGRLSGTVKVTRVSHCNVTGKSSVIVPSNPHLLDYLVHTGESHLVEYWHKRIWHDRNSEGGRHQEGNREHEAVGGNLTGDA